jgi:hypothetical protein
MYNAFSSSSPSPSQPQEMYVCKGNDNAGWKEKQQHHPFKKVARWTKDNIKGTITENEAVCCTGMSFNDR